MLKFPAAILASTAGIIITLVVGGPIISYWKAKRAPEYVIQGNFSYLVDDVGKTAYNLFSI